MASQSIKTLGKFQRKTIFEQGLGALLPEAYKKFYKEWRHSKAAAVHYIPETGKWKRDELTGEVSPVQDIPIPLILPKESNLHIWGGEGIVQGFKGRDRYKRRVPHFWVPVLKRSVVYSEVLDKYVSVVVTDRTINLINSSYGFDHYLLKSAACDLKSLLPLGLKRKILQELEKGCPTYANRPEKQSEILKEYKGYLSAYTSEEIKWYGYSFTEACNIVQKSIDEEEKAKIIPLKHVFRSELIEKLKAANIDETADIIGMEKSEPASWIQKINPFAKKHET